MIKKCERIQTVRARAICEVAENSSMIMMM